MKVTAFFLIDISHPHLILTLDTLTKYSEMNKTPKNRGKNIFIIKKKKEVDMKEPRKLGHLDPDPVC